MTVFEYFKAQYDINFEYARKCINPEVETNSYRFVEIAWKYCFGGTTQVDPYFNIIGTTDTKELLEAKLLKKWDDNSWYARQAGTSRHVALTKKGLKAFYKEMF